MSYIDMLGMMAGLCTTFSFLPQVINIWRTGNTQGISKPMYIIFFIGVILWLVYGFFLGSLPMIIFNLITFLLVGSVLVLLFKGTH
jgi:MtN3 and saliva related transmembrane protein